MLYAYQIVFLLNLFYQNQIVLTSGKVYKLPENFLIGVASSAYQIEGGHNAEGKGENIWDHYLSKHPQLIKDQSNGNIACDSYHRFDDDLQILKDLNVDFYRFSISWSRILPTGYSNAINQKGIDYYNRLINGLLVNDIVPIVTMYHWDLPMNLQQIGGWTNPILANYFADYAQILFEQFGDRVKYWITINTSKTGYGDGECPPQIDQSGIVEYLFVKTILLAHSRVYQLYKTKYHQRQNGQIGITIDGRWYESIDDQNCNREAAERMRQFTIGIYLHPLIKGDYPESLKTRIAKLSKDEHFLQSRIPPFTTNEIEMIHKSYDFIGLNMYTTYLVENNNETVFNTNQTSFEKDTNVKLSQNNDWPKSGSDWLRVEPQGLRKCLNWIKTEYDNPRIFITENGVSDDSEHEDYNRIKYIQLYLKALLESIYEDGVNAIGYTVWSLLDNFEWLSGYTERFGLYYVDFNDPLRRRKAKLSAKWFKQLVETRQLTIAGSRVNQNRLLEFHVSTETGQAAGQEFRVRSATLWLRADVRHRRPLQCRSTEIYVFKIISHLPESVTLSSQDFDRATSDPIAQTLQESNSGWQKLDLTDIVRTWLSEPNKDKLRLFVDCSCCSHWYIHLFNNNNHNNNNDEDSDNLIDKRNNPNRPFLVIHTDPNIAKRVRRRALDCSPDSGNQCCKQRFYVSFKKLGWDDWVIAPHGYYANYCRGDCGHHRTPDTYVTYHTHVIEEVRKTQHLSGMQPCCAPLKFSSMSLIYYGPDLTIIKRDLPKMVVDECGCP